MSHGAHNERSTDRAPTLDVAGVTVSLSHSRIVSDVGLTVGPGEKVGLVGPNGSGKTTLLRTVYRPTHPTAGLITVGENNIADLTQRELARRTALVAQENASDFDFSVADVVALGRLPHQRPLDRERAADRTAVTDALRRTGMTDYRARSFATLSGGEKQRVLLARALAQDTDLLLLDEPTNHLDINATLDLLELVSSLEISVLCVLHDLNLAAAYCDRVYVLDAGEVVAEGRPADVLSADLVRTVFGVHAHRLTHPGTGRPLLAFSPASPDDDAAGLDHRRVTNPPLKEDSQP